MEVTEHNFYDCFDYLRTQDILALDTETTGLRPYHDDMLFSIIIASKDKVFYFNFNSYPDVEPLPEKAFVSLKRLCEDPSKVWVFHTAKFDLSILAREGIEVKGTLIDIAVLGRIEHNDHFRYDLATMAKRVGLAKDDKVEEYIKKHKLWEWVDDPNLNKRYKDKKYNLVPWEIIRPYGENDAKITLKIYEILTKNLVERDKIAPKNKGKLIDVAQIESKITRTTFEMERIGVKIDRDYCSRAIDYYRSMIDHSTVEFEKLTGHKFVKSPKLFSDIFKGEKFQFTEKKNPRFDAEVLATFKHPAAKLVLDYAEAKKSLEYFQGFLFHADKFDVIHANFNQAGTRTGRFSSSDPNLQNLTKPDKYEKDTEDASPFPVRRAFVPREGFLFAMLDYDQMEYRLMLDRAKATGLIDKVLSGLDVHQATADEAVISRVEAKTVNFAVLYGSGVTNIARNLGCTVEKAISIRNAIFKAAPEIKAFIRQAQRVAKARGFIYNLYGRRSIFDDPNFAYGAPNYYIQGSCADIMKIAMNEIHEYLDGFKSRMIMTIHDELVFEIAEDETYLPVKLQEIMQTTYKHIRLPLTCGIEHSYKSLADKVSGEPVSSGHEEKGNTLQRKSKKTSRRSTKHMGREDTTGLH